jgi:hypothetical protein
MAVTVTKRQSYNTGNVNAVVADIAFDSSYPTGGESLTKTDLGFVTGVEFLLAEPASGYSFEYDHTNEKLIARYADYDAAADGALIQVPNTTDLSAVTGVRVIAFGR